MKRLQIQPTSAAVCAILLLILAQNTPAATLYVDAASTNAVPPYSNWATAAAVIQDAVDAAAPGDGPASSASATCWRCSTNLSASPPFFPLATNLPGQPGTTTFTVTNGAAASPRFYRVGVQP